MFSVAKHLNLCEVAFVMDNPDLKNILFPHDKMRNVQEDFIKELIDCLQQKKNFIVHAPTGLGKTAAALCPALSFAQKNKQTIFFLTSRHTQHQIVLDTLKAIKTKYGTNIRATSIIGKKWMCAQQNVLQMRSTDFTEYCKYLRENHKCDFYTNVRTKPTAQAAIALRELERDAPCTTEQVIQRSTQDWLCPYEISLCLAENSEVIIADYYYLFNKSIREAFLKKTNKKLENSIIIIDEGHNLPSRLRELLTTKISNFTLKRAIKEAKMQSNDELVAKIARIQDILNKLSKDLRNYSQTKVTQEEFTEAIEKICKYDEFIEDIEEAANAVRDKQKQSSLGVIAEFLKSWPSSDKGFCRVLKREDPITSLSYKCLDPALASKEVIDAAYCTILMSGTLTPSFMYKDLLGFPANTVQKEYQSPFPQQNKLTIIIPKTTTKYSERNDAQFNAIANICSQITDIVPGSCAIFFPSYNLRDSVNTFFQDSCNKTILLEQPGLSREAKQELLYKLKSYGQKGAVLMGAASGSFGEGVDLPGVLKAVIVVGLPLDKPSIETEELIKYYDERFGKGWDYGYNMPALTKCFQNAGRCIRSENDRGAIIFLDQRYTHHAYLKCFPTDWQLKISLDYIRLVKEFFSL